MKKNVHNETAEKMLALLSTAWQQGYNAARATPLVQDPIGYMTAESVMRLRRGGNVRGAVPIHAAKSNVATIKIYRVIEK